MKVELSIADDRELRSMIKDTIKAEIVSIARGEVKAILASVIKEGYLPKTESDMDNIIKEQVKDLVKAELFPSTWNNSKKIENIARDILRDMLKEAMTKGNLV